MCIFPYLYTRSQGLRKFRSILLLMVGSLSLVAQSAQSSATPPTVVSCVSESSERQVCKADTAAGVALLRSTGTASCLLGKNWGYDDQGIWVSAGCGGEFAVGSTKEANGGKDFVGLFEVYGQWRTHVAVFQDDVDVQDNASRAGMNFATRGKIKMFAGTEWGVNLIQSETQFNLNASAPGQFGLTTATTPVFLARLGFVGIDMAAGGKLGIGKQYAVQYDIASYTTDRFNVFGGQGTASYVAGTDGGFTGTGRVDRVVYYRNSFFKALEVGLQGQFRGGSTGRASDGVGASLQLKVLPGVKAGATYTRTNFNDTVRQIRGVGGNADYMAVGARADWRNLELGAVYSRQHNGDLVQIPVVTEDPAVTQLVPVAFDSTGAEVYARVVFGKFALIGGFIQQLPKVRDPLMSPDFKTRYLIIGGEYFIARNAKIYSESRIDLDSVTATGDPGYSIFTIGFRYDFSWRTSHQP